MESPTTIRTMNTMMIANSIHKGDKTHHHDHVMAPVSFNTIKTIARSPEKLIPELLLLLLTLLLSLNFNPYFNT